MDITETEDKFHQDERGPSPVQQGGDEALTPSNATSTPGATARAETPQESSESTGSPQPTSGQTTVLLPQPEIIDGRSTRTGYVYDSRMRFHSEVVAGKSDHPEDPRRIWRIFDALRTAECTPRMVKIASREVSAEELELVHTVEHIASISKTMGMSQEELFEEANKYNSIYLNNMSAFCARLSCGSLLEICKSVATGEILNGVAIIRPPGHHAEPDEAGGFCLYNNVAVAARYLQKNFGLKKIFIMDWDVHHGNGTQKAFIDDPDVVYCSIHRYDDGSFYPGDPVAAAHTTVGEGAGRGKNINIPWPTSGMGDSEYIYAFNKVIMPIVYEFAPDFVLVSAGFDAALGDHIGQNLVTPAAYGHMTHMLKSLAGGKIVLALEGGYNLDSIAASGLACTKALLSDPIQALGPIIPNEICIQTIHEVIEVQSQFWKSLTPSYINPLEGVQATSVVDLSKVLSVYRTDFLYQKHHMLKMPISNQAHAPEIADNVHVTQGLYSNKSTRPLFIFIHNIGDFCARTMGATNMIRPEKSMLVDTVAQYVERIIKSGNELIDIVVPFEPATEEERISLKEKMTALLADIWDNFVYMTGGRRRIVLLATGFGCHSMASFMSERKKDVMRYVSCAVMIPGGEEALPSVTKRLSGWYMENSFVVVSDDHAIWEKTNQKVNIRTGNIVRSGRPTERLSDSLLYLYHTVFLEIERKLKSLPPLEIPEDTVVEPKAEPMAVDLPAKIDALANLPSLSSSTLNSTHDHLPAVFAAQSLTSPNGLELAQEASRPSSSLGSSTQQPGSSRSLVERASVGNAQAPRSQPYPSPNGQQQQRSLNGGSVPSNTVLPSPPPPPASQHQHQYQQEQQLPQIPHAFEQRSTHLRQNGSTSQALYQQPSQQPPLPHPQHPQHQPY